MLNGLYCIADIRASDSTWSTAARVTNFYRAMHFSANARSWDRMSSVRLSVTLVICDHKDWKSWKLIARTTSLAPSLFVAKRRSTYPQGNMGTFGETRGGVGKKWHAEEQKRQYL